MLAIQFYDVVVAVHVMAIVLAFGVTFAYPIIGPYMAKNAPAALPALHRLLNDKGVLANAEVRDVGATLRAIFAPRRPGSRA